MSCLMNVTVEGQFDISPKLDIAQRGVYSRERSTLLAFSHHIVIHSDSFYLKGCKVANRDYLSHLQSFRAQVMFESAQNNENM